jgi:hypothetical protein
MLGLQACVTTPVFFWKKKFFLNNSNKNIHTAGHQWLRPIILATQEAEIRRTTF